VSRFVLPLIQGQRRKIVAVYLDPSNFKNIGDGHTIADQINEVLQKGQWHVADTCPRLIEAIPSRMHDEKRPGDVLKVPGDPLDDVADDVRYGIYTFHHLGRKAVRTGNSRGYTTASCSGRSDLSLHPLPAADVLFLEQNRAAQVLIARNRLRLCRCKSLILSRNLKIRARLFRSQDRSKVALDCFA
jgi:hypothetical protein